MAEAGLKEMRQEAVVLLGFGRVGRAFARLLLDTRSRLRERYGLQLELRAILTSRGGLMAEDILSQARLAEAGRDEVSSLSGWRPGLGLDDVLDKVEPGVVVECLSADLATGEPALAFIRSALARGWHVAAASKGPLAVAGKDLMEAARRAGVFFRFSGATGAALPAADVGMRSLAGSEVTAMEGILNGTTNFILTQMQKGRSFEQALAEAQRRGIAEPDPEKDMEGLDTAVKLLILVNIVLGADYRLSDVKVEGITRLSSAHVAEAGRKGKKIKLLGRLETRGQVRTLSVAPAVLEPGHPLYQVDGAEKGITFFSDTMGPVTLIGGRSDPRGAAAALLKDVIGMMGL
jgi:homoserine dehydrogenase